MNTSYGLSCLTTADEHFNLFFIWPCGLLLMMIGTFTFESAIARHIFFSDFGVKEIVEKNRFNFYCWGDIQEVKSKYLRNTDLWNISEGIYQE